VIIGSFETPTYRRYGKNSIPISEIVKKIDDYRSYIKTMRFISIDQISTHPFGNQIAVSLKVDGMHVFAYWHRATAEHEEMCFLTNSPAHRTWWGLPVLQDFAVLCRKSDITEILMVGELFTPHNKISPSPHWNERAYVEDILAAQNEKEDPLVWERIGLRLYDLLMINGLDKSNQSFLLRWSQLEDIFPTDHLSRFSLMPTFVVSPDIIIQFYNTFVEYGGHEGLVIHHLLTEEIFKLKPKYKVNAYVLGWVESEIEDHFGGLLMGIPIMENKWVFLGQVHTRKRLDLFQEITALERRLGPKIFSISHTDGMRKFYHWVEPTHIVELEFQGLRPTSTSKYLSFDGERWEFNGALNPLPWQMSYPVVLRLNQSIITPNLLQFDPYLPHLEQELEFY